MLFSSLNKFKSFASKPSTKAKLVKSGSYLLLGGLVSTSILCSTVYAYGDESKSVAPVSSKTVPTNLESLRSEILGRVDFITTQMELTPDLKQEFLINFFPHLLDSQRFEQVLKNHCEAENRVLCEKGSGAFIDHTVLAANTTAQQIDNLCNEAKQYNFKAVCVQGGRVTQAYDNLKETEIGVAAVVGFPLGASTASAKAFETYEYLLTGANEIDMVIDIGSIKDRNYQRTFLDVATVNAVVEAYGVQTNTEPILKVIIECCLLTREEIIDASIICVLANAAYVKTSTGFSTHGATEEHVRLMKLTVGNDTKVKAAGGVRDQKALVSMINQGASRIGTSSGTKLVLSPTEAKQQLKQLNLS